MHFNIDELHGKKPSVFLFNIKKFSRELDSRMTDKAL